MQYPRADFHVVASSARQTESGDAAKWNGAIQASMMFDGTSAQQATNFDDKSDREMCRPTLLRQRGPAPKNPFWTVVTLSSAALKHPCRIRRPLLYVTSSSKRRVNGPRPVRPVFLRRHAAGSKLDACITQTLVVPVSESAYWPWSPRSY